MAQLSAQTSTMVAALTLKIHATMVFTDAEELPERADLAAVLITEHMRIWNVTAATQWGYHLQG